MRRFALLFSIVATLCVPSYASCTAEEATIVLQPDSPFLTTTGCVRIYSGTLTRSVPEQQLKRGARIQFSNFYSDEYRTCIQKGTDTLRTSTPLEQAKRYVAVIIAAPNNTPRSLPKWLIKPGSLQALPAL